MDAVSVDEELSHVVEDNASCSLPLLYFLKGDPF